LVRHHDGPPAAAAMATDIQRVLAGTFFVHLHPTGSKRSPDDAQ
jgi:hypothetical protein